MPRLLLSPTTEGEAIEVVAVREGEVEEEAKEEVEIKGIKVVKGRKVKSTQGMEQPGMLWNILRNKACLESVTHRYFLLQINNKIKTKSRFLIDAECLTQDSLTCCLVE